MRPALYDVLEGRFGAGPPMEAVPASERALHSVIANLQRLFNTRQGAVEHLPDYGLPDLTTVYRDAPDSFDRLRRALREAVERYEPRLRRVHVEPAEQAAMRLSFIVSGELERGRRIRLQTTFISQEPTVVRSV